MIGSPLPRTLRKMDKAQLHKFEQASMDLMSPPHTVSEERRKQSEAVFMEFKKIKSPYNACKFVLENSQIDFVLFQAASVMRDAVIREWQLLSEEEKAGLRQYLLHYLTSRPSLTPYVQRQLVHMLPLMVKRATLEAGFAGLFRSILDFVSQLLATGEVKMRQLGCSLLTALLTEYSSSSGSSAIGLPLDFHFQCKKAIENDQLLQVLRFAVQVLQQFAALEDHTLSTDDHALLSSFLQLTSQILNWDFRQQQRFFRTTYDSVNIILRPPRTYAPTFLDPGFLSLFFRLLPRLQSVENDFHHVVQCLTQLASLTRPVFSTEKEQKEYLVTFVTCLLEYMHSRLEMSRQEVYGLSCILRRLTSTFSVSHFSALGSVKMEALLQAVAQLTCLSAEKAVKELEDDWSFSYSESMEHYLEVCTSMLNFSDSTRCVLPKQHFVAHMTNVFDAYIKSKLSAPKGWRVSLSDGDEIVDVEEDDCTKYGDELSSIGNIARTIPYHSLPLLISLLEERTTECLQQLLLIQRDPSVLESNGRVLDVLYEDLHWLALVAGYTLCDIVKGEAVLIPTELMKYSIDCYSDRQKKRDAAGSWMTNGEATPSAVTAVENVDFDRNVAALVLEADMGGGEGARLSELDPVVGLVMAVCRLCLLEKKFISAGLIDQLSPQLCESIAWSLQRITEPYVMFNDEDYGQVSLPLVAAFGKESTSGKWLTAFLMEKVAYNLSAWSSEEVLAQASIQLLHSLTKSLPRANVCIECEVLWSLMRNFASGQEAITVLPPPVQRTLMTSLVMSAMGERKKEFLTHLLESLQRRFSALVQSQDFPSRCEELDTKWALLSVLEPMCGLASSTRVAYMQEFFHYLLPVLRAGVKLLPLYDGITDVVTIILELYVLVAENYIIFLNKANTIEMYRVTLQLIQTYANSSLGSMRRVGKNEEEEQYEDLLLFMKLLSFLTTKDYMDMGPEEGSSGLNVDALEVVMTGIHFLLPLVSEELLQFPKLCTQFYSLIHYTCQCYPQNVLTLPNEMVVIFMNLLEVGLNNFTQDTCSDCLDSIYTLATHFGSSSDLQAIPLLNQSFQHLLQILFELVLSSYFDMDLIGGAAAAIFSVICIQQTYYSSLAEALVNSRSDDPQNHSRLVAAFHKLTPPTLGLDLSSHSKLTFLKNLEEFLPFVKGFLTYK